MGPVVLSLDAEWGKIRLAIEPARAFRDSANVIPRPAILRRSPRRPGLLVAAENPVIVSDRMTRTPAGSVKDQTGQ